MIVALQTLIFFRETLLKTLDHFLRPYYKKFSLAVNTNNDEDSEDDEDDHVFADYDEEKGVVFYPPMYAQRYAAVSDCLMDERWSGKIEKVVDLGYHDMSYIKYLKDVPGVRQILGVDVEVIPLRCSSDLFGCEEYTPKRENPLTVTLFQGNAADPDFRLIGCDAVVSIEMIEHMLPHDLERLVHTVFGFIKPRVAIFTTPNADFNVLFKALEKNNYRRLDHLFEWTREQFNDWCSNIVVRYPEYTVNCKGIGPGPEGTLHLGCCSQMAVFIAKDYHKQQELDPNSLAMIANEVPEINILSLMNWGSQDSVNENSDILKGSSDFFISEGSSRSSVMLASTISTKSEICNKDKIAQCNLDGELAKSYLMFEDDNTNRIVVPRKTSGNKIYIMEDVNSRLNCSTLQVKKFSKTTQNLMAKNKMDHLVHTREVVAEMKQLRNMLNFKQRAIKSSEDSNIWCNINWGENAPYWNQYYKVVRDYTYPFEAKSDETRILDLIYDEMNKLIDMQYENEFCSEPIRLEVPIEHLMRRVQHITADVEKVKDLLDWNGYEIIDDVVVHTRLLPVDNHSTGSKEEDWLENDTTSECDSGSLDATTEGSSNVPDMSGRLLRRAIDLKVRKLRSMVSADEDITTELDRVVCRLMKLALRTSKGRKNAMPTKWLHCKLFDLLTLTEKTIERRRQHFVENYAFKAIGFGDEGQEISALLKFKEDKAGLDLMDKYHHLVEVDKTETIEDKDLLYDDNISLPSEDIKGNELMTTRMSLLHPSWLQWRRKHSKNLERTEAWVNRETLFKHFNSMKHNFPVSDIDIEQSISNGSYNHRRKSNRKIKSGIKYCTHLKKSSCTKRRSRHKTVQKEGNRHKHNKKTLHRKSSHFTKGSIVKVSAANVRNFKIRKCEINSSFLHSTKSKPIPGSLIKLCSPQYNQFKILRKHSPTISDISKRETEVKVSEINENLDSNEESNSKVTDGQELSLKVFAPQLSLSKMAENVMETKPSLQDTTPKDTIDEPLDIRLQSNNRSQTIFLYDINEPSTSKGVRHVSMDVQCGPDTSYEKINHVAVTSCSDICTGVEMRNPPSNSANNSTDFGTSMNKDEKIYRTLIPRIKSIGIKIRDSDVRFSDNNRSTITDKMSDVTTSTILPNTNAYDSTTETDTVNLSTESSNFNKQIMNNKSNSTFPKILSILHDAPENIKTYLSSPPKTLETNIANCLISRLKLCYSGIRIRSFKSKKEFQEAFPEKTLQATTNVNKLKTFTVQKKKEGNIKTLKRDSKFKLARTKSYTKEIKRRVETEKKILQTDKPNLQSKSIPNENKGSKKGIQIRNPKLTMVKPKLSNETSNKKHIPVSQSSSLRSRQSNEKKVQSKKGTSSDLKNKPKHMCATWSSKDFMDKKNESKVSLKTIPPPKYLIDNNKNRIMMNHLNKSFDSIKRYSRTSHIPVLKRSKTEEMKINLAKMQPNVFSEYYVYRNETKNSLKASEVEKDTTVRSSSPQSIQSSTCSSPASVQTVKLRPKSVSPNSHSKMRTISPDSKSISSIKSKKSLKIGKRISEVKSDENKENNIDCKHSTENEKNKVFIAKLNCTPLQSNENSLVKRKSSKSVRIPDFTDDKKEPFVVKNHSSKSICNKNVEHDDIAISDQDITFVMHDTSCLIYPRSSTPVNEEDNDGYKFRQMIENSIKSGQILDVVTSLVDDIIEKNIISDNSNIGVGALNVNLEHDDYKSNRFEDTLSSSFGSCKTAIENLDIIKEHDDEEDSNTTANTVIAHNISLNTSHIVPEVEVLPGMKYSTTSDSPQGAAVKNNCSLSPVTFAKESVLDLFERKNTLAPPVNASPLALQAFSGFSVNTEPVPGDQPDYVNQIDSETGSGANDVNRQATSEELFVSGRSSVMYESCLIEEDTVVPEWLFQIINQQQIESEETSELRPAMLPVSEPMYDVNGSNVETVGNEAGAGDGRGVHSDVSQDSSGQGSSITSSDTSSAPQSEVSCTGVSTIQSEAVLIDPTVLAGQYAPPLPNPVNSDSFRSTQESSDNTDPPRTSREVHHDTMALLGASDADADADESSLDTDAD